MVKEREWLKAPHCLLPAQTCSSMLLMLLAPILKKQEVRITRAPALGTSAAAMPRVAPQLHCQVTQDQIVSSFPKGCNSESELMLTGEGNGAKAMLLADSRPSPEERMLEGRTRSATPQADERSPTPQFTSSSHIFISISAHTWLQRTSKQKQAQTNVWRG